MSNSGRLARKAHVRAPVPDTAEGRTARVSVIIPCYNYGHFLSESVSSALSQEGVEPEVIVVDDASTDDSAAVAERLAAQDSRVTVVRHLRNTGHVVAFNDGLAAAAGEFVVRLDADDLLTPGSLVRATALFDAYPEVGLVYGHPRHFTEHSPPTPRLAMRGWSIWSGADWVAERCRRGVEVARIDAVTVMPLNHGVLLGSTLARRASEGQSCPSLARRANIAGSRTMI